MMKKEEDCEKLEREVVSLRKILRNSQEPKDITHLGWMGEKFIQRRCKYQQEG
jgi:hypothetical protein